MPTEIQYGDEAGGREWALSRGGKHSNNTMKRRRSEAERCRIPRPPTGDGFKWLPGSLSSFPSLIFHVSLSAFPLTLLLCICPH